MISRGERQGGCKVLGTKGQPSLGINYSFPTPSIMLCNEHRRKQVISNEDNKEAKTGDRGD